MPAPEFPTITVNPGEVIEDDVLADIDGDGFTNDVDECLGTAGPYQGCPEQSALTAELHIVDQTGTLCVDGSSSCKITVGGLDMRVIEMPVGYTPKDADQYFENGTVLGDGATAADGTITVPHLTGVSGSYLAVGRWAADVNTLVYVSKEIEAGVSDLKFMKQVKNNGEVRYLAASVVVTHSSVFETVYLQPFVAADQTEYHPVVYVTEENRSVDVCADAPEGYELTSIMDENDQITATTQCTYTVVPGDTRLFLFTQIQP